MFWHCSTCGHDNEEMDTTCLLCGSPKPVTVAPEKIPVCSLTATRAKAECNYADVTVPSKYNVIGEDAFKGRTDLYTIRIHSGVTKILRGAFDGCTNLYAVYVEGKLTSIGPRAFAGCKFLSPDRRPTAGTVASDAFAGCSNINIGTPSRTVASSAAARKTTSTSSSRPSTATRPSAPAGTASFSKTTSSTASTATSFTRTTPSRPTPTPTRPASPTPPPSRPAPPPPPKAATYTPPKYTSTSSIDLNSVYAKGGLCLLIAFLTCVAVFLFTDWGLLATWEAWQVALGLSLTMFVGMFTHYLLYDGSQYGTIAGVITAATVLASLNWIFDGGMTILSTIVSVGCVCMAAIYAYIAFDDSETGQGWWRTAAFVINLANVIAGMVVYNYRVTGQLWQVIIAVAILVIAAVFTHESCYYGDYYISIGVAVAGIAVSLLMLWIFGGILVHIAGLIALGCVGFGVITAVCAFCESETGFGVGCILTSVANLAVFIIAHLVYA